MRWTIFGTLAFIAVVGDVSLRHALRLWDSVPSLTSIVVVFVALFAPRWSALWAAWVAGLFIDLMTDLPHGPDLVSPMIGPHALGYTFGAYLLLQVRPMLLRRRVLTIVVMAILFAVASTLVVVFIYGVHGWYEREPLIWADLGPVGEMLRRFRGALYTGVIAFGFAPLLVWTTPMWGFRSSMPRSIR